jgi:hypothetical protein
MSDYRVIQQVALLLQELLFEGLSGDDEVGQKFTTLQNISLASPVQLNGDGGPDATVLLSLYLYQVTPNGQLNNHPPIPHGLEQRHPPLSLDLCFLLTPRSSSPEDNLVILGRALQILEARSTIRAGFLDSDLRPPSPELRLLLERISLEELTRIWNAFNEPYQLSVSYKVQFVSIDTTRQPEEGPPVTTGLIDTHLLTGTGPRP